jgi:hypothetical protein
MLFSLLENEGEPMSRDELKHCIQLLVGEEDIYKAIQHTASADDFAENILGFEEVEDDEEDEEGQGT